MPKAYLTPAHKSLLETMGADLRALRVRADVSQEDTGEMLGWNKDAISKIERGINNTSLYDYLRLMMYFRDVEPKHPAVTLARRFGMLN